jgi:hypothetical protein
MAMVRFGYANAGAELKKRLEHPTWFKVALSLVVVSIVNVLLKQSQRMA